MIRLLLAIVLLSVHLQIFSQRCVTPAYNDRLLSEQPGLAAKQRSIREFIRSKDNDIAMFDDEPALPSAQTILLPVVVHVLYNNQMQNISDQQIFSQIEILNADFLRLNADTINTPARFRPMAANTNLRFKLATVNPAGGPTNGIVRKQTPVSGFRMDDKMKFSATGGDEAWDSDKYLNIWVVSLSDGIVGYASTPGSEKDVDGIVIRFNAFGNRGTAAAPYDKGRTAVHEIGHWLGLIHTWGDTECGDDYIDDTPPQQDGTAGCPPGNVILSCNNGPNGDMYMNYMDVTDDACTNLFTNNQKETMRILFEEGGPRHALLSSKAAEGGVAIPPADIPLDPGTGAGIRIFPNPAKNSLNVHLGGDASLVGQYLSLFNQYGQLLQYQVILSDRITLDLSRLSSGVYFIKLGQQKSTFKVLKTAY